jgi:hypothetical protein
VIVKNFNKMSIKNHNYLKITDKWINTYILVLALSLSVLANAQQTPVKTIEINIDSKCQSAYW